MGWQSDTFGSANGWGTLGTGGGAGFPSYLLAEGYYLDAQLPVGTEALDERTGLGTSRAVQPGHAYLFDGTNDVVIIGSTGVSVTTLTFSVKQVIDNQQILTLANSVVSAITVVAGVVTWGASLSVSAIVVDGVAKSAAQAGALLNDNTWHTVVITMSAFTATDLRMATDGTAFGNLYFHKLGLNASDVDGLWKLDEGSGTTAYDSSGNGNDGVITNATLSTFHYSGSDVPYSWQNEVGFDQVATFDVIDDYIPIDGNPASLQITGDYSISGWMYIEDISATPDAAIFSHWFTSNGYLLLFTGSKIRVYRNGSFVMSSALDSYDGMWFHFAVTAIGTAGKIYIDGSLLSSGSFTGSTQTISGSGAAMIGNYQSGAQGNIGGHLSRLKVYNRGLTPDEVTWIFTENNPSPSGTDPTEDNLVGHWKLDEVTGLTAADSSANGNDGTVTGATAAEMWAHKVPVLADGTSLIHGGTSGYTGQAPRDVGLVESNCVTLDGVDDYIDFGSTGIGVTEIKLWVKLVVDDQEILTLANSAVTGISVAAGVLTYGGSLTVSATDIDGTDYTSNLAGAGVLLNDNLWHELTVTLTSSTASALRLGTDDTIAFGNIQAASLRLNTATFNAPLAEGQGTHLEDVSGNGNDGTLTNASLAAAWANTQDVVHYNLLNGYSLYEHATLDPIYLPYQLAGTASSFTPPSGYTLTGNRPAGVVHNGAETGIDWTNGIAAPWWQQLEDDLGVNMETVYHHGDTPAANITKVVAGVNEHKFQINDTV